MEQEEKRLLQEARRKGGLENRKHVRVRASWRAQISTAAGPVEAKVVDVGEQGIGMLCDQAFPTGAILDLVLGIPDQVDRTRAGAVGVQVQIMFSHFAAGHCRLGAQFSRVSAETSALIRWHVSQGKPL